MQTVTAAAPGPPIAPKTPQAPNCRFLQKNQGLKKVSKLFPERHLFWFKVPEMPLKAHASSAVGAKNRFWHRVGHSTEIVSEYMWNHL